MTYYRCIGYIIDDSPIICLARHNVVKAIMKSHDNFFFFRIQFYESLVLMPERSIMSVLKCASSPCLIPFICICESFCDFIEPLTPLYMCTCHQDDGYLRPIVFSSETFYAFCTTLFFICIAKGT